MPGEAVVPGGTVGDEGVPAHGAPALGDPVALEHEVRYAVVTQVLAHRHTGLAGADDEDLDLFVGHAEILSRRLPCVQQMLLALSIG